MTSSGTVNTSGNVSVAAGVDLHVERTGSGPPLMLLHGFTGDGTTIAGLARRLEADAEVVVPDLVGHGRSCCPVDDGDYSVEAMAAQVAALGEECLGGPFHLVGYSMGGRVALTLACRRRELLRSLTLIGASAGLADKSERAARRLSDNQLAESMELEGLESFVDRWMAGPLFATQKLLGDDFLAAARAQRLGNSPVGLARSLRAAGTGAMLPLHDDLRRCDVPTVFVAGAQDPKFTAIAVELAGLMPTADVAVIEGAGHAAHLEQPDAVAAVVRAQLGLARRWD